MYNMNGHVTSYANDIYKLLFCLNHSTEGCISSVQLISFGKDTILISSRTKPEFEGKKYNKLLRAATIIISPLLQFKTLSSYAINPISTWLLMDSFNATTSKLSVIKFLFKKHVLDSEEPDQIITKNIFTKELIQEYHGPGKGGGRGVDLKIDLTNPANIETAEKVFHELISTSDIMKEIKCN